MNLMKFNNLGAFMKCHSLFSVPVFSKKLRVSVTPILNEIYKIEKDTPTVHKSNKGGWQSPSEPYFLDKAFCNKLKREIIKFLREISKSLGDKKPIDLNNSWANINRLGCTNASHTHPWSYFSGVFYLQTDKVSGPLIFETPITQTAMPSAFDYVPFKTQKFTPMAGECIVFPSWLSHRVELNKSRMDRVSIAFNTRTHSGE